jgi:hypothetical protein
MAFDDPIVLILFLVLLVLGIILVFPNNGAKIIWMFGTFLVLMIGLISIFVLHLFFGVIVLVIGTFLTFVFSRRSKVLTAH